MRLVPRLLLGLAAVCVVGSGIGCRSASPGPPLPDPPADGSTATVQENRSRVEATVLSVEPIGGPRFRLDLRVDRVTDVPGYASFARTGDTIRVYPNFVRREGHEVDYSEAPNVQMSEAARLSSGDRVEGIVYRRDSNRWLLMEWRQL